MGLVGWWVDVRCWLVGLAASGWLGGDVEVVVIGLLGCCFACPQLARTNQATR